MTTHEEQQYEKNDNARKVTTCKEWQHKERQCVKSDNPRRAM
jgi:hypothetical protein